MSSTPHQDNLSRFIGFDVPPPLLPSFMRLRPPFLELDNTEVGDCIYDVQEDTKGPHLSLPRPHSQNDVDSFRSIQRQPVLDDLNNNPVLLKKLVQDMNETYKKVSSLPDEDLF